MASLTSAAIKIALLLSATDKATPVISESLNAAQKKVQESVNKFRSYQEHLDKMSNRYLIAGSAITDVFKECFEASENAEKSNKRLEASFDLLEDKGKGMAEQAKAFAKTYSTQIGVSAGGIRDVQTQFTTFNHLFEKGSKDAQVFQRATQLAFDVAVKKGDIDNASTYANQLGRFLNDPAKNFNAVKRLMGGLTDNDKKHIESLYKQHKYVDAQVYALGQLEKKFKGIAVTQANQTDIQKVRMGQLMASIGTSIQPAVNQFLGYVNTFLDKANQFAQAHPGIVKGIGAMGIGLLGFSGILRGFSVLMGPFISLWSMGRWLKSDKVVSEIGRMKSALRPLKGDLKMLRGYMRYYTKVGIDGAKTAVQSVGSALSRSGKWAMDTMKTAGKATLNALSTAGRATMNALKIGVKAVGNSLASVGRFLIANPIILIIMAIAIAAFLIYKHWDKIKAFFIKLWAGIKQVFSATWEWIKKMFFKYHPVGLIISHWKQITAFFSNLWAKVKNVFMGWVNWVAALPKRMVHVGAEIISNIWHGITSKVSWFLGKIKGVVQKIRNFFPFSPAKDGPLKDLHKVKFMETLAMNIRPQPITKALTKVLNPAMGLMKPQGLNNYHNNQSLVFAPVINMHGGGNDAKKMEKELFDKFKDLMRKYNANQSRTSFSQ